MLPPASSRSNLDNLLLKVCTVPGMRVGDAARQAGTSPGCCATPSSSGWSPGPHRRRYRDYGERDLAAAAYALGSRAATGSPRPPWPSASGLEDPEVAGSLRRLARLRGSEPVTALDYETAKARRLLRLAS